MIRPSHAFPALVVLVVLVVTGLLAAGPAHGVTTFGADASVWDSSVAPTATLLPIGGSGQINGAFALDTMDTVEVSGGAIQLGLRAQERFVGPSLPRFENVYYATSGESSPGLATWNYDFHMDFGTSFLAADLGTTLSPLNLRDYDVTLSLDNDPSPATAFFDQDVNALLDAGMAGPDIRLFQNSWNLGFGLLGGPLDPNVGGFYDLRLTVASGGAPVASTEILVVVDEPAVCLDPVFGTVGEAGETGIEITGTPGCLYQVRSSDEDGNVETFFIGVGDDGTGTDTELVIAGPSVLEVGRPGLDTVTDQVEIEGPAPSVLEIPTVGTWGLLVFGLGLALAGGLWLRT